MRIFTGHTNWVTSLVAPKASPELLYSASSDGTVREWDIEQGACLRSFDAGDWVMSVALVGGCLLGGTRNGAVARWNLRTGLAGSPLLGHTSAVVALATQEGKLYTGSEDGTVRVWQGQGAEKSFATLVGHEGAVTSVCPCPLGLVSASNCTDTEANLLLWPVTKEQKEGYYAPSRNASQSRSASTPRSRGPSQEPPGPRVRSATPRVERPRPPPPTTLPPQRAHQTLHCAAAWPP